MICEKIPLAFYGKELSERKLGAPTLHIIILFHRSGQLAETITVTLIDNSPFIHKAKRTYIELSFEQSFPLQRGLIPVRSKQECRQRKCGLGSKYSQHKRKVSRVLLRLLKHILENYRLFYLCLDFSQNSTTKSC